MCIWAVIICSSVGGTLYFKSVKDEMDSLIEQALAEEDIQKAAQIVERLDQRWQKSFDIFVVYIKHNDLDSVSGLLSGLAPLLEHGDTANYKNKLIQIKDMLDHILRREIPYVNSVL